MNAPSYFEIQASDVKRAVAFDGAAFGWQFARVDDHSALRTAAGCIARRPAVIARQALAHTRSAHT